MNGVFSDEQLAKLAQSKGISLEELKGELEKRKKRIGSSATAQSKGSQDTESAGESTSVNTLSDSLEIPNITAQDLTGTETEVAARLAPILSKFGLYAEEGTTLGSTTAVVLRKRQGHKDFSAAGKARDVIDRTIPGANIFAGLIDGVNVGDTNKEDLEESAKKLNEQIAQLADKTYLENSQKEYGNTWTEYTKFSKPKDLTEEEKVKIAEDARLDKFESIRKEEDSVDLIKYLTGADDRSQAEINLTFGNRENYEDYKKWLQDKPLSDLNEDQVNDAVKDHESQYIRNKTTEFARDLSLKERQAFDALVDSRTEVIQDKAKNYKGKVEEYENKEEAVQKLVDAYEKNPTSDGFDQLTNEIAELNTLGEDLNNTNKFLNEELEDPRYLQNSLELLKRNYSRVQQLTNVAKGLGKDFLTFATEYGLNDPKFIASKIMMQEIAIDAAEEIEREGATFQESIDFADIKNPKDFATWSAGAATNLLPSLALAYTGPAALPLFFASGVGGKASEQLLRDKRAATRLKQNTQYLEDNVDLSDTDKLRIQREIEEDKKTLAIPESRKITAQIAYGLAEVVFERVGTLKVLDDIARLKKALPPKTFKEAFVRSGSEFAKGIGREGGSEFATTVTQNIFDIYETRESKNVFEGGLESFAQGALMGGGLVSASTPRFIKQAISSELATKKENKRLEEIMGQISDLLGKKVDNFDASSMKYQTFATPEVRKMVEELTQEADGIRDGILEGLAAGKYTAEDLRKIGDANRDMRDINNEFLAAVNSDQFSPKQLKAMEKHFRAKYENALKNRADIVDNESLIEKRELKAAEQKLAFDNQAGYNYYLGKLVNQRKLYHADAYNKLNKRTRAEAMIKARQELGADANPIVVERKARENFINGALKKDIELGIKNAQNFAKQSDLELPNIESFETNESFLSKYKELKFGERDLTEEEQSDFNDLKLQLENGEINGMNLKNGILVHVPNAIKNGAVGVGAHEMLHAIVRQMFGQKGGNEAGKKLLEYLEQKQPDLHAIVKTKIDGAYAKKGADGELELEKDYYEEAMNALSDALADGAEIDTDALLEFKRLVSGIPGIGKLFKLNTNESIYEFIRNFNNQAHFGGKGRKLNIKRKSGITPEEEDKASKAIISAAAERAKKAVKEVENDYRQQLNSVLNQGLEDGLSRKEAEARAVERVKVDQFDPTLFEQLEGMIGAQVAKYKNKGLQFKAEQDFIAEVQLNLFEQNDITKFNGFINDNLYGYINKRINFRVLDVFRKDGDKYVEDFGEAAVEDIKGKEAQQVSVAPDVETTKPTEEVRYKSLVERKVVSDDALNNIKNKVKVNVRLLKTRMDKTVSKNVTVRPYIAEIRKTMGKQADIDLKKEMGGIKEGKFRKFLLKHKRAILENMTTTYLMTAMPNAVQKKVDGVFTSNWKGKKIDRETVATDQAGRTSGAEVSRRLPNASTRLSDADFLSNFLNEDGSLIRGRKESLAKAMAEELSFDIINESLQDPNSDIRKAFEQNQEVLGVQLADNFVVEVKRDIERGNVKFSKALLGLSTEQLAIFEAGRNDFANAMFGVNKKYTEAGIKRQLETIYKDNFTPQQYKALAKDLYKVFKNVDATVIEEGILEAQDFAQILADMSNDIDFLENVHKLVGASVPIAQLYRNNEKIDEAANELVKIITNANVPVAVAKAFLASTFANSGRRGIFRKDGTVADNSRADLFMNVAEVEAALVGEGKAYNRNEWDNAEKIPSSAKVNKNYINGDFAKNPKLRAADARAAKEALELTEIIIKGLKKVKSKDAQAMILAAMNSGTNTALRVGAPVTHFAGDLKNQNPKNYRYEHATPARVVLANLFKYYVQGDTSIDIDALKDDYKVAIIPKAMDKIITKQGFAARQIIGYIPGITPWYKRYYNIFTRGLVSDALTSYDGKETIGQEYVDLYKRKQSLGINQEVLDKDVQKIREIENRSIPKLSKAQEGLANQLNEIISRKKDIDAVKEFSRIQAQLRGKKIGRYKFFIRPAADDFRGLIHYAFAGKGKQGEADMKFFEENLMEPYFKGVAAIDGLRQQIKRDYKEIGKQYKNEINMLKQPVGKSGFNYDHALRVYMWNRQGIEVEGLSKRDTKLLLDAIAKNPELINLADAFLIVARKTEWPAPKEYWEGGSILGDLNGITEKIGRKELLEEFIQNADAMFSEANLNKIEALYGREHREAIEDALYAMKNGTNRPFGNNKLVNRWLNWINGATGAIMFFNRRSALLQVLSAANFINWSDNNPAAAAKAFANQKQYWADFAMIFNSDKLKERRGGLKQDVNANEIADAARGSKNSPQAILRYLLKIGFTPTQIADSFAIALGGASFYRNRVNRYLSQGLSQKEAQEKAFLDFSKKSDEAQQSSDPALVSQEQRSVLGRLVLAFANTPIQYTRLMKKAGQDLINGRGNPIEHVSKIAYYGLVQNFIFSALQSALFALAFDDEGDDEETDKRTSRVINSMVDTILRGSGLYGAIASTIKNTILEYSKQQEKGWIGDHTYTILAATSISPPINSKLRKLYSAIQTRKFEKENVAERGWALTADGKLNLGPNYEILGKVLSGTTNVPLDRVVDELKSISEALDGRNKAWQRIALALGWKTWDVGVKNEEADLIQAEIRKQKRTSKKEDKKSDLREAQLRRAGIKK